MEVIHSTQNQHIKKIQNLKNRKFRERYKEYLLEGLRAVEDTLPNGRVKVVLFDELVLEKKEFVDLQALTDEYKVQTYSVQHHLFKKLGYTEHSQGVIAIGAQCLHSYAEFSLDQGIYLLLDRIQDPGNLGTIIRTAVASDVKGIFFTKGSVDVYNDKVVRSAMSALDKVTIYESLSEEAVNDLIQKRGLNVLAAALEGAQDYNVVSYDEPLLLVLGNEGNGISKDLLDRCPQKVMIPLYGEIESLNISVAAGILLYKAKEKRSTSI